MTTGPDSMMWQDQKRHLWLLGLIAPTALLIILPIMWAMNQAGWHTASKVLFWMPILFSGRHAVGSSSREKIDFEPMEVNQ